MSPQQDQPKITTTDPINSDNFQNDEDPNLNHDDAHDVENPPRVITIVPPPAANNSNNINSSNNNINSANNNTSNNNTAEDEVSELDETLTQYTYATYVTKRCCSTRALTFIVLLTALIIFLSRGPAFGLSSSSSQNGVSGGVSAASSGGNNSSGSSSNGGGNVSSAKPTQVVEEKEKDKKQEAKSGKQR